MSEDTELKCFVKCEGDDEYTPVVFNNLREKLLFECGVSLGQSVGRDGSFSLIEYGSPEFYGEEDEDTRELFDDPNTVFKDPLKVF